MSFDCFWPTDEQFARLAPPLSTNTRRVPRVDDRRVISGIVHLLRTGCRWKDAPACHGRHETLCNRFVRWAAKGVWEDVFTSPATAGGPPGSLMIEATHAKARRSAAGGKGGPRRRPSDGPTGNGRPRSTPRSTSAGGRGG